MHTMTDTVWGDRITSDLQMGARCTMDVPGMYQGCRSLTAATAPWAAVTLLPVRGLGLRQQRKVHRLREGGDTATPRRSAASSSFAAAADEPSPPAARRRSAAVRARSGANPSATSAAEATCCRSYSCAAPCVAQTAKSYNCGHNSGKLLFAAAPDGPGC